MPMSCGLSAGQGLRAAPAGVHRRLDTWLAQNPTEVIIVPDVEDESEPRRAVRDLPQGRTSCVSAGTAPWPASRYGDHEKKAVVPPSASMSRFAVGKAGASSSAD